MATRRNDLGEACYATPAFTEGKIRCESEECSGLRRQVNSRIKTFDVSEIASGSKLGVDATIPQSRDPAESFKRPWPPTG
jgi:hypothetical protein